MSKPSTKSKNALRHGLYASDMVLPWENEADFKALLAEFCDEYQPLGPTEQELVIDLTRLRWIKRRIMRSAQLRFREDVMATRIGQAEKGSLDALMDHVETEAKRDPGIRQGIKEVKSIINQELTSIHNQQPNKNMTEEDRVALHKLNEMRLDLISRAATGLLAPLEKSIQGLRNEKNVVELAYAADTLERIIRLEAIVDVRFEKTLGRLLALQDFKRTTIPKQIEQVSGKRKSVK
jgi:hypothetical protein